ncbi:hypothetical protein H8959_020488, partial [Pygathrix nigripes]
MWHYRPGYPAEPENEILVQIPPPAAPCGERGVSAITKNENGLQPGSTGKPGALYAGVGCCTL